MVEIKITQATGWKRAVDAARFTVGKKPLKGEPSSAIKRKLLMSEHSPIRLVEYDIEIYNIPMWVTTHLVRHYMGVEKFVRTQREDRNDEVNDRDSLPQGAKNSMLFTANAQALINISRDRLCSKASKETRAVWRGVANEISVTDPDMGLFMVKKCIYRGFCPEIESCGYTDSLRFTREREEYLKLTTKTK